MKRHIFYNGFDIQLSLVPSTTLATPSWFKRTCSHKRRFAHFTNNRIARFKFGGLADVAVAETENGCRSFFFQSFLLFSSFCLLVQLLHSSSLFHINCSVSRTRNLDTWLFNSISTYLIEINLFRLLLLRGLSKSLVTNISNHLFLEFVLLSIVTLE